MRRRGWRQTAAERTLTQRLAALAGLVAIVGVALIALLAAGVLGSRGGGEGIERVAFVDTPPVEGRGDLSVGAEPGKLAPDFEISDMDGVRHRLSDFRGKVVYVNFWATWCTPCIIELPDIQRLQEQHPDDLVVIAVNRSEPLDRARSFLNNLPHPDGGNGLSFPVNALDPDDSLYSRYGRFGMPVSVFIDPDGVVTRIYNGIIPLDLMQEAVNEALIASVSARAVR
jgi:thiol-disulfide isomerase/thioredoxin